MGKGDFGYFGKGTEGYIHYMQAFNESQKDGGGGHKPSSNSGCLTLIVSVLGIIIIIAVLFAH